MASIFTFDPDPPRVSSPWSTGSPRRKGLGHGLELQDVESLNEAEISNGLVDSESDSLGEGIPLRLEAEPQEGPTEYKLHLLLRPRRALSYISTARKIPASRSKSVSSTPRNASESSTGISTPILQITASRQHRLEQLTTQLLWRLQQSSPYHSSSATNLILPSLPEATTELQPPQNPAKLLPGLEDSKGALYEIGVSDDGTFIGLIEDEMEESLNNLRAMAASLGCSISVLRMVHVGICEWYEESSDELLGGSTQLRKGKLYVAEAYIKPVLKPHDSSMRKEEGNEREMSSLDDAATTLFDDNRASHYHTEQIRVSLTGATTCGKSSLLGTLSTSTLDNGRGKSRLSLLKHRHEIASGMTSSVAQELIGYNDQATDGAEDYETHVINYAAGNVSSWDDIHASSNPGRLSFLSDCAGHPRYRRTTVRGLVGWAPHWTFLCIAANDGTNLSDESGRNTPERDGVDFSGAGAHISMAHLDLCLRLQLPLVVVITKLDLASKVSIRQVLSTVLTTLKAAGRKPALLSNDNGLVTETDLQTVRESDAAEVVRMNDAIQQDFCTTVPILFTSSVKGTGMRKLHALLRHLPIPSRSNHDATSAHGCAPNFKTNVSFHIDDSFSLSLQKTSDSNQLQAAGNVGCIISGHLSHGAVSVGDELSLGPFSVSVNHDSEDSNPATTTNLNDEFLSPRSFSDALARATSFSRHRAVSPEHEWRRVRVISIRNLRLPSRQLQTDQVGTIGIVAVDDTLTTQSFSVRKGMVLVDGDLTAAHTFTASFDVVESSSVVVGTLVVVYCASVRASANVIAISLQESQLAKSSNQSSAADLEDGFGFSLEEEEGQRGIESPSESILVTFQFLTYREWLEVGSRILIMPGGGYGGKERGMKGFGGMEGFVGRVVERFG